MWKIGGKSPSHHKHSLKWTLNLKKSIHLNNSLVNDLYLGWFLSFPSLVGWWLVWLLGKVKESFALLSAAFVSNYMNGGFYGGFMEVCHPVIKKSKAASLWAPILIYWGYWFNWGTIYLPFVLVWLGLNWHKLREVDNIHGFYFTIIERPYRCS